MFVKKIFLESFSSYPVVAPFALPPTFYLYFQISRPKPTIDVGFPIQPIKRHNSELGQDIIIQTPQVDINHVWVRSGTIKGMNPANSAKPMLCHTCIKGVSG
jgi:hypothetical protein